MSVSVKLELFLTYLTFGLSDDVSAIDGLALQSTSAAEVLGQCEWNECSQILLS